MASWEDYLYYDFREGKYHTYPSAYQYDINREIMVAGVNVGQEYDYENVRCEFSYETVPGLLVTDTIQIESNWSTREDGYYREFKFPVPDICFQKPGMIHAYIVKISNTLRRTLGSFCIRIIGRPKPSTSS